MTTDTLYETDFVTWTERQAEALRAAARAGSNLPVDWENLAEEVKDLGSEALHQIQSLTRQVVLHLLKLACSPADQPRAGWVGEVDELRNQLGDRLAVNHAIRARFAEIVDREFVRAATAAERSFRQFGEDEALPRLAAWRDRGMTASEVLDDGLFPVPGTVQFRREPG